MKTTKTLILSICAMLAGLGAASAQQNISYPLISAANNAAIPALSTNATWNYPQTNTVWTTNSWSSPAGLSAASNTNLLIQPVSQFDYVGMTFGFLGTVGSTNALLIYESFDDGATYGALPVFSYTGIVPGADSYITNCVLDVHGATTLAFVLKNSGTTDATNAVLEIRPKSSKVFDIPSTR